MMRTASKQKGMTMIGWLLVIMILFIMAIVAMKLMPVYLDGYKVSKILASMGEDTSLRSLNNSQLRDRLLKRLDIDMVSDVTKDDIVFSRNGRNTVIEIEYEARRKLFGNLDAVIAFDKSVEIPSN